VTESFVQLVEKTPCTTICVLVAGDGLLRQAVQHRLTLANVRVLPKLDELKGLMRHGREVEWLSGVAATVVNESAIMTIAVLHNGFIRTHFLSRWRALQ
jgi:hypothetical protein